MTGANDMKRQAPEPEDLAADWFWRLNETRGEAHAAVEREFRQWLNEDPRHAEAFANVSAAWDVMGDHAAAPEIVTLRQSALADARAAAQSRWKPSRLPRWGIAAIAGYAAAALLLAGGYYYVSHMQPKGKQYATQIGQREALTLSDNSHVDIDADSAVSIALSHNLRLIHLQRGQAYFQVAHDRTRPFIVQVNGQQVIATGTAFNVEAIKGGVRVTLVEGHVVVRQAPDSGAADAEEGTIIAKLSPGDQLTDVSGAIARLNHTTNLLSVTAWRQGKLIFNNDRLADIVQRMKHYSTTEIVITDPSIANLRVSGVFNAGDIPALVDALKRFFPIEAYSDGPNQIRLVPRKS